MTGKTDNLVAKSGGPFSASGHLNDLNHLMIELRQSKQGDPWVMKIVLTWTN
jgi:hypothetical protein